MKVKSESDYFSLSNVCPHPDPIHTKYSFNLTAPGSQAVPAQAPQVRGGEEAAAQAGDQAVRGLEWHAAAAVHQNPDEGY